MGRERGWVSVSVATYQSHRSGGSSSQQRVVSQEYTVDEAGATLNAVSRSSDIREEERLAQQAAQAANSSTTSIFIRDWKVRSAPAPISARQGAWWHGSATDCCSAIWLPWGLPRAPPPPPRPAAAQRPHLAPHWPSRPTVRASRSAPSPRPPSSYPCPAALSPRSQLSGRRAFIKFERDDGSFWFNPVIDDQVRRTRFPAPRAPRGAARPTRPSLRTAPRRRSPPRAQRPVSSTPGFPCNRGDIFLKLGMRGARLIPWRLREGDVFRLGQAYVLVAKVRLAADQEMDVSSLSPFVQEENGAASAAADASGSDDEGGAREDGPQCYICYEEGDVGNPLINPCQCAGSVKYVHLNCLQKWIQPEGSSAVNTHCPVCKARRVSAARSLARAPIAAPLPLTSRAAPPPRYPEKTQTMMVRPPAILLESWSNHRSLKLRHWVSFAQHGTASLGRFVDHNDVVIPDHSVSGEHALIVHANDEFWLHDRESSNGSFIRLCAPLRLSFGEPLHLKMGKSLLCLQAKRSRWLRLRMRLNLLRLGGSSEDDASRRSSADCVTPSGGAAQPRTARSWANGGRADDDDSLANRREPIVVLRALL